MSFRLLRVSSLYHRNEFCDRNPIESVRQGSKPKIKPAILSLDEIRALMAAITTPAIRVAVLVAAVTGLRRSEVRGLKWCDIDWAPDGLLRHGVM